MTGSTNWPKIPRWAKFWIILIVVVFTPFQHPLHFAFAAGLLWLAEDFLSGKFKIKFPKKFSDRAKGLDISSESHEYKRKNHEGWETRHARNHKKDRLEVYFEDSQRHKRHPNDPDEWQRPILLVLLVLFLGLCVGVTLRDLTELDISRQSRESKPSSTIDSTPAAKPKASKPKPKPKAKAKPKPPKPKYDPALEIKNQVYFFQDTRFPNLNTEDYKKAAGDLARIQYEMIKNRSQAKNYPDILIGNGDWKNEVCNAPLPTLGLYQYSSECDELITINFEANDVAYEHQIEVLITLAHEWGHHLINLSGENVSAINNELLADCFAGLYVAYLLKYDAITLEEVENALRMMADIGNTHGEGVHGTPLQRMNGLGSGAGFFADRKNPKYRSGWNNYCKGLEDVIDIRKSLP